MEAFTFLKYWRGGSPPAPSSHSTPTLNATTTILTAVAHNHNATETDNDDDSDGPFFDLEFAVPDEVDDSEDGHENPNADQSQEEEDDDDDNFNIEESDGEGEREFKFTLSPSSNDRSDPNLSLSPSSDDVFLKGKLVQVEPSSFSETNSKPQFTASLLKSATKFRVFMLGLKKYKSMSDKDSTGSDSAAPNPHQPESQKKQSERKLFTVKFKVEEVPIKSLFTRDNSSRGNKPQSQNPEESPSSSDEKRFSKEVMHKYLKMVKPLYVRVSRRYGDKLNSSKAAAPPPSAAEKKPSPAEGDADVKSQKQGNLPAGLRVVCKHLGKSRSASSAVAAAPPGFVSSKRRDDSLLQQQDGIQGAILHCKKSFNASNECETSQLPRSVSVPLHDISSELSRKSINEGKDKRL
ncbi:probable membrane-associated kinase regulator 2 [Gastrolobium bilobum]|uniref:probable membrane-associated kinase regulator 2 n=1 Tax=Gastrolobium bilobum TaxID=150636 RepID=UPI002AB10371|nr:probable membrane-associated kinase regulator 2 [Gastrolobium bilobum]